MGRKRGDNVVNDIRKFFSDRPATWLSYQELFNAPGIAGMTHTQLRKKLHYLVQRGDLLRAGGGPPSECNYMLAEGQDRVPVKTGTAIHEQVEAYITDTEKMEDEPEGTFKIIGNLVDFQTSMYQGVLVQVTSPGWSNRPYLLKEL